MIIISPYFPKLYNVNDEVKAIATAIIAIDGILLPIGALYNSAYYTLRSGGKALLTSIFDSGLTWLLALPVAFILSRYTDIPLIPLYAIVRSLDIVKGLIGLLLVKKRVWINRLV